MSAQFLSSSLHGIQCSGDVTYLYGISYTLSDGKKQFFPIIVLVILIYNYFYVLNSSKIIILFIFCGGCAVEGQAGGGGDSNPQQIVKILFGIGFKTPYVVVVQGCPPLPSEKCRWLSKKWRETVYSTRLEPLIVNVYNSFRAVSSF